MEKEIKYNGSYKDQHVAYKMTDLRRHQMNLEIYKWGDTDKAQEQ